MSDFDRNYATARSVGADRALIDAGLRAYMVRVYNYMTLGLALTGVVAWFAYQAAGGDAIRRTATGIVGLTPFGVTIFTGFTPILLMLVTLGLVFFMSFRIDRLAPTTAFALFAVYSGLLGLSLSSILFTYTGVSITRVFFISAATFGAMSLYGYTTQRDLSKWGSFLMMGLIGLIIAMVVNIFLQSTAMQFIISCVGVLIFVGLTAYDTQSIKEMYDVNDDGTVAGRKAIMGALRLYLDFINLFIMLLQIFGDRK